MAPIDIEGKGQTGYSEILCAQYLEIPLLDRYIT